MGMNMAGEHCPNCGDELEDGQIGLCEACRDERAVGDAMLEKIGPVTIPPEVLATMPEDYGLSRRQIAERKRATHGSPELDADARKLEAMGQDAGPTLDQLIAARRPDATGSALVLRNAAEAQVMMSAALVMLRENLDAWDGEEDSVKEEHAELIARTRAFLDKPDAVRLWATIERLAASVAIRRKIKGGAHVDGE